MQTSFIILIIIIKTLSDQYNRKIKGIPIPPNSMRVEKVTKQTDAMKIFRL